MLTFANYVLCINNSYMKIVLAHDLSIKVPKEVMFPKKVI